MKRSLTISLLLLNSLFVYGCGNSTSPIPDEFVDLVHGTTGLSNYDTDLKAERFREFTRQEASFGREVVMPGEYIVVFKEQSLDGPGTMPERVDQHIRRMKERHGLVASQVHHVYAYSIFGFSATLSEDKLASVSADSRVDYVSPVGFASTASLPRCGREDVLAGRCPGPPPSRRQVWPIGIERVGAAPQPGNVYVNTGLGIYVAVIDTGVDLLNPDLMYAFSPPVGTNCIVSGASPQDDHGHGTHVTGTIAARDNNIDVVGGAPGATIVPVKVLSSGGFGLTSWIICGVDYVTANAPYYGGYITIANMSLGGYAPTTHNDCGRLNSDPWHQATCRSVDAGVTYVVAAGNSAADISSFRPAGYPEVIAVSALGDTDGLPGGRGGQTSRMTPDDATADFSNYSAPANAIRRLPLPIKAPGVGVLSLLLGGGTTYMSGTSMASPHVAFTVALLHLKMLSQPARAVPTPEWTRNWLHSTNPQVGIGSYAEEVGRGNTDPSGRNPEPVLNAARVKSLR